MWLDSLSLIIGLFGVGFGIWQYKKSTHIKKVVNDHIRGLYYDAKKILEFAKKQDNYLTIAERARAIKSEVIRLDIINRNLTRDKISKLKEQGKLTDEEATEYKIFSSD